MALKVEELGRKEAGQQMRKDAPSTMATLHNIRKHLFCSLGGKFRMKFAICICKHLHKQKASHVHIVLSALFKKIV